MALNITKLPRQAKYQRKLESFVVTMGTAEIGMIEKMPNYPYEAIAFGGRTIGKFIDKAEAAKAIHADYTK